MADQGAASRIAPLSSAVTAVRKLAEHADSDADVALTSRRAGAADPGVLDQSSLHTAATPSSATDTESLSAKGTDEDDTLARMSAACRTLLECLGENPNREGLLKTPMRMAKALLACTAGYNQDPASIVSDALFECEGSGAADADADADASGAAATSGDVAAAASEAEMVLVRDIECYSMCEHHMLPFFGRVHIGYYPAGRVVGLSKLARLTDCFAKRLQIQERLTQQIATAVQDTVGARGVAVMVEATHMCMTMRGVEKPGSITVTSAFTGCFKADRELRSEFNSLVRGSSGSSGGAGRR